MENKIQTTVTSFLNKVMPTADLPRREESGLLYKNTTLTFQLVIKAEKTIIDGSITVESELKNLTLKRVGFVNSTLPVREDYDDYIISSTPGLYPDSILDVNPSILRISGGINNSFYFMVDAEEGLVKGDYPVKITVFNRENKIAEEIYTVKYTDIEIKTPSTLYANWVHYDSIAQIHRVEPFGNEFYTIFESYLDLFKREGANLLMIPLITPSLDTYFGGERKTVQLLDVTKDGDRYIFDFKKLDYFIDFVSQRGIKFFEFPPFYSQWGAKYAAKIVVKVDGKEQSMFGWNSEALSEEYSDFLIQMLSALQGYLNEKGCLDRCYFHVSDETDKCKEHYLKCKEVITGNITGVKFIDTVTKAENISDDDIQVLAVSETVNMTDISNIKSVYYCWGDYKNYVSNRFFSMPLERTAVIWIQMYLNQADLLLQWGFNFYQDYLSYNYIDPFADSSVGGIFPSGDAFIVYPDTVKGKAFSSIRLEAMRYGKDLQGMLLTLESLTSKEYTKKILEDFGFKGYNVYPREDGWMKKLEEVIYEEIIKNM